MREMLVVPHLLARSLRSPSLDPGRQTSNIALLLSLESVTGGTSRR